MTLWIKLYLDLLDDSKMAKLPDWIFRRFIDFLLIAKENDKGGELQPVTELAWRIRQPERVVDEALRALEEVGVVHNNGAAWVVTHFAKRQYSESYERVKKYREKRYSNVSGNASGNAPVTIRGEEEIEERRSETSDPFITMIMTITGLMVNANDMPVITKWEKDGVTEDDIRDAIKWRVEQELSPLKCIANLNGGVETSRLRRIQGKNGKAAHTKKPTSTPVERDPSWHP